MIYSGKNRSLHGTDTSIPKGCHEKYTFEKIT